MLPNPERDWERRAALTLSRDEVERRVGRVASFEPLSGGLANANVRLGDGRVLRVYRRDPTALPREAALLSRPWTTFVVPRVLARGDDFLVLEDVAHAPLEDRPEHGAAIGRALAEIHATRFDRAGFLDGELRVAEPFEDWFTALVGYALPRCRAVAPSLALDLARFLERNESRYREAAGPVLLHADFKASNLHWTSRGPLVLDWEFAWSGPSLLDVGQLSRWGASDEFARAFASAYGPLPDDWERRAAELDLFNLAGLLEHAEPGSRRARDVVARMSRTLTA